jgi:hypothetical protein
MYSSADSEGLPGGRRRLRGSTMSASHKPQVQRCGEGIWRVTCVACSGEEAAGSEVPVGIGLPVHSRLSAEWLARNHAELTSRCLTVGSDRTLSA